MPAQAGPQRQKARECPHDWTPLVQERVSVRGPDLAIDRCPTCDGIFLDKNELARLTGDVRLNKFLRDHVGLDSDSEILCPHCGGIMDAEAVDDIEVDVCLTCYGIWLDAGELQDLKDRPERGTPAASPEKEQELVQARYARASGATSRNPGVRINRFLDEIARRYL